MVTTAGVRVRLLSPFILLSIFSLNLYILSNAVADNLIRSLPESAETPPPTPGETPIPNPPNPPIIECGNGIREANEECDDGNNINEDNCSNICRFARCGDKITHPFMGEECDHGANNSDTANCSLNCKVTSCGDKKIQNLSDRKEQCDDGNFEDGDGCTRECKVEFCGDGKIQDVLGEECDQGDGTKPLRKDGCGLDCQLLCGNGVIDINEQCDMGDQNGPAPKSICSNNCTINPGICGNAKKERGEECDHGLNNGKKGDSCNRDCTKAKQQKPQNHPGGEGDPQGVGFNGGGQGGNGGGGTGGGNFGDIGGGQIPMQVNMPGGEDLNGFLDTVPLPPIEGISLKCGKGTLKGSNGVNHTISIGMALTNEGEVGIAGELSYKVKAGKKLKERYYSINGDSINHQYTIQKINKNKTLKEPKDRRKKTRSGKSILTKRSFDKAITRMARASAVKFPRSASSGNPVTVDILFAYTPSLDQRGKGQIAASAAKAICTANEVLKESDLEGSFKPVGLVRLENRESGNAVKDLDSISDPKGEYAPLHAARKHVKADLVTLLVDNMKNFCGFANIMPKPKLSSAKHAFSVISQDCITTGDVAAHEWGHNLGMHHDHDNADGPGVAEYGYGYRVKVGSTLVRTIMAYPPGLQVRKFSSPKLSINGVALGEEGKSDNRRVAKETLSIVSKYSETLK